MEQEPGSQEVRTHRIAKILSVLGIVLIAFGILIGIAFPVAFWPAWNNMYRFDDASRFELLIRVPWTVLAHIAAGAICLGVSKAIQILEEIRAGR